MSMNNKHQNQYVLWVPSSRVVGSDPGPETLRPDELKRPSESLSVRLE
jgi:hypothetical protein